jgi:hypothetical protein
MPRPLSIVRPFPYKSLERCPLPCSRGSVSERKAEKLNVPVRELVPTCRNRRYEFPEHRSLTVAARKAFLSHDRKGVVYANSRRLVPGGEELTT